MQETELIKLEYQTLRKEIEDAKSRLFRIMTGGVLILPAAGVVAQMRPEASALVMLLLPLVISAFMYLFLAQSRTIMRAGTYIKLEIEAQYLAKHKGWEHWLEDEKHTEENSSPVRQESPPAAKPSRHRTVDNVTKRAFLFLYAVFYVASAAMVILLVWPTTVAIQDNPDCLVTWLNNLGRLSHFYFAAGLAIIYIVILAWSIVEVVCYSKSHTKRAT